MGRNLAPRETQEPKTDLFNFIMWDLFAGASVVVVVVVVVVVDVVVVVVVVVLLRKTNTSHPDLE